MWLVASPAPPGALGRRRGRARFPASARNARSISSTSPAGTRSRRSPAGLRRALLGAKLLQAHRHGRQLVVERTRRGSRALRCAWSPGIAAGQRRRVHGGDSFDFAHQLGVLSPQSRTRACSSQMAVTGLLQTSRQLRPAVITRSKLNRLTRKSDTHMPHGGTPSVLIAEDDNSLRQLLDSLRLAGRDPGSTCARLCEASWRPRSIRDQGVASRRGRLRRDDAAIERNSRCVASCARRRRRPRRPSSLLSGGASTKTSSGNGSRRDHVHRASPSSLRICFEMLSSSVRLNNRAMRRRSPR